MKTQILSLFICITTCSRSHWTECSTPYPSIYPQTLLFAHLLVYLSNCRPIHLIIHNQLMRQWPVVHSFAHSDSSPRNINPPTANPETNSSDKSLNKSILWIWRERRDLENELTESIAHPIVLTVPIIVFGGTKSMSDTFQAVHYWTGEIVDREDPESDMINGNSNRSSGKLWNISSSERQTGWIKTHLLFVSKF